MLVQSDPPPARSLAPVLIDTVRRLRLARLVLRLGRARYRSVLEALRCAIDLLVEKDNEITRLRAHLQQLRDENRQQREEMQRYLAAQIGTESA